MLLDASVLQTTMSAIRQFEPIAPLYHRSISTFGSYYSFEKGPHLDSSIEELSAKLKAAEASLSRAELLAAVAHHAARAMHEASNPLEVLTNVHYLTRHTRDDPAKVVEYIEVAEDQARRLLEIISRVIRLHQAATEDDPRPFLM